MEAQINGTFSLKEQEDSLSATENSQNVKLVSFKKGDQPGKKVNYASFVEVKLGEDIPDLVLVNVPPERLDSEKAAQQSKGKSIIFYSLVYVGGNETNVAGFR